jgi:hypothetical protein
MSLDEFLGFYRGTIYPEMLQDDLDPTETLQPTNGSLSKAT